MGKKKLKRTFLSLLFACFIALCFSQRADAARRFGLGVVLAGPTGLTAEYIYARNRDMTASFGWGDNFLHLNLDHHWNRKDWIKADGVPINIYFGFGLRYVTWSNRDSELDSETGLRFPVGVQHFFKDVPIQIFFELAPVIVIVPYTGATIDLALGARYFF